jgi:hypothetical protein
MDATVKYWLKRLYKSEIEEVKSTIRNEHLWELGYDGEDPNPHTENLLIQEKYLQVLEEQLKELGKE